MIHILELVGRPTLVGIVHNLYNSHSSPSPGSTGFGSFNSLQFQVFGLPPDEETSRILYFPILKQDKEQATHFKPSMSDVSMGAVWLEKVGKESV